MYKNYHKVCQTSLNDSKSWSRDYVGKAWYKECLQEYSYPPSGWDHCKHMPAVRPTIVSKIFNTITDALEWTITNCGPYFMKFVLHYLDDFLLTGRPHTEACKSCIRVYKETTSKWCRRKFWPITILEFLEIWMNQLVWRTLSKLGCIKSVLSLVGYLQHATIAWSHLWKMIDMSKRQVNLDAPLRLNSEFRSSVTW